MAYLLHIILFKENIGDMWYIGKSKEGIAHVFFLLENREKIIMLHMFIKKFQKTSKRESKIMKEVM